MESTHSVLQSTWPATVVFRLTDATQRVSPEVFEEYCRLNPDLRLELTACGELVIMSPTGGDTGDQNAELTHQLRSWSNADGRGRSFDSNAGFTLPNGAILSPDASWVLGARYRALTAKERRGLVPLCPDFVAEIKSPSDSLRALRAKMKGYIENGTLLGILIHPDAKWVELYRPEHPTVTLENPERVDLSPEMPKLILDMTRIWSGVEE